MARARSFEGPALVLGGVLYAAGTGPSSPTGWLVPGGSRSGTRARVVSPAEATSHARRRPGALSTGRVTRRAPVREAELAAGKGTYGINPSITRGVLALMDPRRRRKHRG